MIDHVTGGAVRITGSQQSTTIDHAINDAMRVKTPE